MWLAQQGLDVLSIDFSPAAQAKVRALAKQRNVSLRIECVDVIAWDYPENEFDVVAAIFIQFADPGERRTIFAGIRHELKSGGLLLMQGYRPSSSITRRADRRPSESRYRGDAGAGIRRFRRAHHPRA